MKQFITKEQWRKLSKPAEYKLQKWWGLRTPPTLSIGQMIEFLDNHTPEIYGDFEHWLNIIAIYGTEDDGVHPNYKGELCDALWEAVKKILETKH